MTGHYWSRTHAATSGKSRPTRRTSFLFADAVEVLITAQEHLVIHERRRCIEPIIELVLRQHLERWTVLDDERHAFAAGQVDAALRADRGREHVGHAVEPLKL